MKNMKELHEEKHNAPIVNDIYRLICFDILIALICCPTLFPALFQLCDIAYIIYQWSIGSLLYC